MNLPITAAKISLAYNTGEDRLAMLVRDTVDGQVMLVLTRRLTGRLINGLGSILKRSSPTATSAPEALRDDVILMEHQQAVSSGQDRPADEAGRQTNELSGETAPREDPPIVVVTDIDVTTHRTHFELTFRAKDRVFARAELGRRAMHLLVDALTRRAQEADWQLRLTEEWLSEGQTSWVLN